MRNDDQDFLKGFYQALEDKPLSPDDAWYVPLYEDQDLAPTDPVAKLQRTIEWSTLERVQLRSCRSTSRVTSAPL